MTDDEQGAGAPKRLGRAHDKFGRLRGKENGGRERGLQRIRDHHHRIAFLMARGKRALEISKQTGFSLNRVLYLRNNPEFRKLLEIYEAKLARAESRFDEIEFEEHRAEQKVRAANLQLALEEQHERLLEDLQWFGTIRGRTGLVFDRFLAYGTGGLAFGDVKVFTENAYNFNPNKWYTSDSTTTRAGWTIGGGGEYALADRWTVKAEYLYYDLGTINSSAVNNFGQSGFVPSSLRVHGNLVRVGLNYKFGYAAAPVYK